ncbi:MAG TPA: putative glycolipid-binding domain-containing protein [Acidimicrobiia bacterium]|nr:putative glycolipid-binding domain-containing protein [Acidimicrobiia bacterium]
MTTSTYVWRRLDLDGLVFVRLEHDVDGVLAEGYEICADGDDRWVARFAVKLATQWRHRGTTIEVIDGTGTRRLELSSDDHGAWARNGQLDASLDGCTDVDLAGNPFTNAFVTRRVAPEVGADVAVPAAYVETPTLSVRPLEQRYQRLATNRWVYADDEYGRFEFSTDAEGITIDYAGLAQRL